MNGGGAADRESPPLHAGDFLLQLLRQSPLQRSPRQHHPPSQDPAVAAVGPTIPLRPIQSDGHDLPPNRPPLAPHAYIHGYPPNPNPNPNPSLKSSSTRVQSSSPPLSDSFQKLGIYRSDHLVHDRDTRSFLDKGDSINGSKTSEGNCQFNRLADNFQNSPNRNPRGDAREGDRKLNGYEVEFQNSPNSRSEVSNRVLNGYGGNSRKFLNSSRIDEGNGRAFIGVGASNRNSPNSSRIGEGNNRALNGVKADYLDSSNSSRIGEGHTWVLNGFDSDFPNYSRNLETISRAARQEARKTPPVFLKKATNMNFVHNVDKEKSSSNGSRNQGVKYKDGKGKGVMPENRRNLGGVIGERRASIQLNFPGPPSGSTVHSVSDFELEEFLPEWHSDIVENGEELQKVGDGGTIQVDSDDWDENVLGYLEKENGSSDKNQKKKHDKDYRSDTRGRRVLAQWMRKSRRMIECRNDIDVLNAPLLAIYNSLVPSEEEKMKQKQLLALLEKLVTKEWPEAELLVYGSCANSFGVKKSDIDICLAMKGADVNKSEVLLRLADILKAENLENVQALTHARVPIVKLMDPVSGISCDICINNLLAVVNSKLLRDYAKIDARLRQLAFIVKHWAKLRGVNETYHGTLSSYAYVLMCIHFLQRCRPAILPCLQGMDSTYDVIVDNVECAFFDQVEKLSGFGLRNGESIGKLVWGFFRYWAYCHDYAHDVVSVRLGSIISKQDKYWTRRVGNDRHLICIEDPFEISHDLGRVVDKYSIKVLREEFERAAEILQHDPSPCVTLFEPYVPI